MKPRWSLLIFLSLKCWQHLASTVKARRPWLVKKFVVILRLFARKRRTTVNLAEGKMCLLASVHPSCGRPLVHLFLFWHIFTWTSGWPVRFADIPSHRHKVAGGKRCSGRQQYSNHPVCYIQNAIIINLLQSRPDEIFTSTQT